MARHGKSGRYGGYGDGFMRAEAIALRFGKEERWAQLYSFWESWC